MRLGAGTGTPAALSDAVNTTLAAMSALPARVAPAVVHDGALHWPERADAAIYQAKEQGRGRCVLVATD